MEVFEVFLNIFQRFERHMYAFVMKDSNRSLTFIPLLDRAATVKPRKSPARNASADIKHIITVPSRRYFTAELPLKVNNDLTRRGKCKEKRAGGFFTRRRTVTNELTECRRLISTHHAAFQNLTHPLRFFLSLACYSSVWLGASAERARTSVPQNSPTPVFRRENARVRVTAAIKAN